MWVSTIWQQVQYGTWCFGQVNERLKHSAFGICEVRHISSTQTRARRLDSRKSTVSEHVYVSTQFWLELVYFHLSLSKKRILLVEQYTIVIVNRYLSFTATPVSSHARLTLHIEGISNAHVFIYILLFIYYMSSTA